MKELLIMLTYFHCKIINQTSKNIGIGNSHIHVIKKIYEHATRNAVIRQGENMWTKIRLKFSKELLEILIENRKVLE